MWQFANLSTLALAVSGFGFYDAGIDAVKTHRSRKHAVGESLRRPRLSGKRDHADEWASCQAEHLHLPIIRFGESLENAAQCKEYVTCFIRCTSNLVISYCIVVKFVSSSID